jgi:hypothetical protein
LDRILSILTMSNDPMSNPKHPFGMTPVKLVEDSSVSHLGDGNKPLVTNEFGSIVCDSAPVPLVMWNYSCGRHGTLPWLVSCLSQQCKRSSRRTSAALR